MGSENERKGKNKTIEITGSKLRASTPQRQTYTIEPVGVIEAATNQNGIGRRLGRRDELNIPFQPFQHDLKSLTINEPEAVWLQPRMPFTQMA